MNGGAEILYIYLRPAGETMSQCGTRVTACLRRLLEEKPEKDLVIMPTAVSTECYRRR